MIKTEDIPHLENSTFSTRVVKDIAQNILSFLKSNCTKEGHTYWLFKGGEYVDRFFYFVVDTFLSVSFECDDLYLCFWNLQLVGATL